MILNRESSKFFKRGKPRQRTHRSGVRTAKVGGKLFLKVLERMEGMGFIETPLVFTMTAFNLTVVSDEFMTDIQLNCHLFKKSRLISGCCLSVHIRSLSHDAQTRQPLFSGSQQKSRSTALDKPPGTANE